MALFPLASTVLVENATDISNMNPSDDIPSTTVNNIVQILLNDTTKKTSVSMWDCKFTYVSFGCAIAYTAICTFCIYLLYQLLQQHRRRPQKAFLTILGIQSLARAIYFALWPFKPFDDVGCQPSLTDPTHPFFDILGTVPACLLISAFSLYVLTIARVNKLFALHYNYHSPAFVAFFYRLLAVAIGLLNIIAITSTITDVAVDHRTTFAKVIGAISVWSVTIGLIFISIAFVYVVRSLYNMIQITIDDNVRQQLEQLEYTQHAHQFVNPSVSGGSALLVGSLSGGNTAMMMPNVTSFNYHYDGDGYFSSSGHAGGVQPGHGIQSTIGQDFRQNLLANPQSSAFSYGYKGRLALNPMKNPMRHLLYVSFISCAALIFKAILFVSMFYVMPEQSTTDPKWKGVLMYGTWFFISEIVPSVAMLITFKVVSAPTLQWQMTYANNGNGTEQDNKTARAENGGNNNNNNNGNNNNLRNNQKSRVLLESADETVGGSIAGSINTTSTIPSSFGASHSGTINPHHHKHHNNNIDPRTGQTEGGYHATVNSLYELRQREQSQRQRQEQEKQQAQQQYQQLLQQQQQQFLQSPSLQLSQPTMIPQNPSMSKATQPQNIQGTPTKQQQRAPKNTDHSNYQFDDYGDDFGFVGSVGQGSTPSFRDTTQQYLIHTSTYRHNTSQPGSYGSTSNNRYMTQPSTYNNNNNNNGSNNNNNNNGSNNNNSGNNNNNNNNNNGINFGTSNSPVRMNDLSQHHPTNPGTFSTQRSSGIHHQQQQRGRQNNNNNNNNNNSNNSFSQQRGQFNTTTGAAPIGLSLDNVVLASPALSLHSTAQTNDPSQIGTPFDNGVLKTPGKSRKLREPRGEHHHQ